MALMSVYGQSGLKPERVQGYTLDQQVGQLPVDWLKIDVEGHELHVLRGAEKILRTYKPLVIIELQAGNQKMAGHTTAEVVDFLGGCGYQRQCEVDQDHVFMFE
jgi:hypothetical protein